MNGFYFTVNSQRKKMNNLILKRFIKSLAIKTKLNFN